MFAWKPSFCLHLRSKIASQNLNWAAWYLRDIIQLSSNWSENTYSRLYSEIRSKLVLPCCDSTIKAFIHKTMINCKTLKTMYFVGNLAIHIVFQKKIKIKHGFVNLNFVVEILVRIRINPQNEYEVLFSRPPTAWKSGRWWTPPAATRTWRRSPPRPRRTCRPTTLQRTCRPPTSKRVQLMKIHQALPTDTRSGMESSGPSTSALVSRNTLWISINSLFVRCKVENMAFMWFTSRSSFPRIQDP